MKIQASILFIVLGAAGCASESDDERPTAAAERNTVHAEHGKQMFDEADTDGNGTLSKSELEAAPGHAPMLAAHFAEIDADGDGALSHDEIIAKMAEHHAGMRHDPEHGKQMFDGLDVDDDAKLSATELEAATGPGRMLLMHFDEIDANGDDALDHDEIAAAMARHHGTAD